MIGRRHFLVASTAALVVGHRTGALAQTGAKVPLVGYLSAASRNEAFMRAFRQGLADLGHVEGRTIRIEERYADGDFGRVPELVEDLLRRNIDVFFTGGANVARTVLQRTTQMPMVVFGISDLSQLSDAVAGLARPGGNVTGFSAVSYELQAKQLEMLREIVPGLSTIAALARGSVGQAQLANLERAARTLGMTMRHLVPTTAERLGPLLQSARDDGAGALLVVRDFVTESMRDDIVREVNTARLPAAYEQRAFVEAGGLLSYGTSFTDLYRRAADYVDKILKGTNPADLPIQQPAKFELVVNLKTAQTLGITLPPSILIRAEEVIE